MVHNWQLREICKKKTVHFSFSYYTFTDSIAQGDDCVSPLSLTQDHYKLLLPSSSSDEHSKIWREFRIYLLNSSTQRRRILTWQTPSFLPVLAATLNLSLYPSLTYSLAMMLYRTLNKMSIREIEHSQQSWNLMVKLIN